MTEHEILRVYESGVVDDWEWVGTLSDLGGGQYAFLLEQVPQVECSDSHFLEQFSTGDELVEFVQGAWWEGSFEYWPEVIQGIAAIAQPLALEVIQALEESELDKPSPEKEWAARATWERRTFGGGGAQWAAIAEGLRGRAAILHYIRQCEKLPTGLHRIRVSLGSVADGADCPPPRLASQPAVFERDVKFPDDRT
jgi:hypothetical protein